MRHTMRAVPITQLSRLRERQNFLPNPTSKFHFFTRPDLIPPAGKGSGRVGCTLGYASTRKPLPDACPVLDTLPTRFPRFQPPTLELDTVCISTRLAIGLIPWLD